VRRLLFQKSTVGRCEEMLFNLLKQHLSKYQQTFPYAKPEGAIENALDILRIIFHDEIFRMRKRQTNAEDLAPTFEDEVEAMLRVRASRRAQAGSPASAAEAVRFLLVGHGRRPRAKLGSRDEPLRAAVPAVHADHAQPGGAHAQAAGERHCRLGRRRGALSKTVRRVRAPARRWRDGGARPRQPLTLRSPTLAACPLSSGDVVDVWAINSIEYVRRIVGRMERLSHDTAAVQERAAEGIKLYSELKHFQKLYVYVRLAEYAPRWPWAP